jgi:hypothetical protein
MDIIQDLPNDLKDTIKDIVRDYKDKQKFIRDNIKKHSFYIQKKFSRETRGPFYLYCNMHITDNFIYGSCYTECGGYWSGWDKDIRCIPIMPFTEDKREFKKMARIIKGIFDEYIVYIYHRGTRNFTESTKCEYKLTYTDWEKSIINSKICDIKKKQNKLKTKDIYKSLCELWLPNLDFMESIDILKEQDVYIHEDTQFNMEDSLHDIGSYPISDPITYSDLIMIQKELPIIYSLLEKYDKLYSTYVKLPDDIIELMRMKERFEDADSNYYKIHTDTNPSRLCDGEIIYDANFIEDKETFNSKVEIIFDKYKIQNTGWRADSGYSIIPYLIEIIKYYLE